MDECPPPRLTLCGPLCAALLCSAFYPTPSGPDRSDALRTDSISSGLDQTRIRLQIRPASDRKSDPNQIADQTRIRLQIRPASDRRSAADGRAARARRRRRRAQRRWGGWSAAATPRAASAGRSATSTPGGGRAPAGWACGALPAALHPRPRTPNPNPLPLDLKPITVLPPLPPSSPTARARRMLVRAEWSVPHNAVRRTTPLHLHSTSDPVRSDPIRPDPT